jgi:hypothetical protein
MTSQAAAKQLKESFVPKYLAVGDEKFYHHLIMIAMLKVILIKQGNYKETSPEILFLDLHDQFLLLYRREGDETFLQVAKVFRRAAHKMYRVLLKQKLCSYNSQFLNIVK